MAVCFLALAARAEMIIATADGSGADTFIGNDSNKGPNNNYGSSGTMDIRDYENVRAHIGYVRFDIRGVKGGSLAGARLQLFITSAQNSKSWNIYGLKNNDADDAWPEMAITYNTAPGMLPAPLGTYAVDETKLTWLGTLFVPAGSNYWATSSTASLNLDSFLAADTNGLVTLVLIGPSDRSGTQFYAAAKEGVAAPVLILPYASGIPAADMPDPNGSEIISAGEIFLSWRPGQIEDTDNPEQMIVHPDITGYYLYIAQYEAACDPGTPDFSAISPIYVPRGTGLRDRYPATAVGLIFGANQVIYWRVDESIQGSGAADSGTAAGAVWRFQTSAVSVPTRRYMENLGRGVVAVRKSGGAFISWRLLGLDPAGIGFNLYRSAAGSTAVKLNSSVLTGGTCYTDTTANFSLDNTYYVKPVIGGVEQQAGGSFTLKANTPTEPCVVIPLEGGNSDAIHFVWVGDLDGDGEYDFVADRLNNEGRPQKLEAFRRDGARLWVIDLGPNSTNTYNIEPGSSCVDVGHWDGVTVYDLDCDGRAEVMIRTANGVTFADGSRVVNPNDNIQYISVVNGLTGVERARMQIPTDYIADGPMGAHFGIGYLNGRTPSLVASMKNRIGSGDFNLMICAWDFDGASLKQKWKWLRGSQNCSDGHNLRIADIDADGMDEICHIGFALDQNGTLLYNLADSGVAHGDRWHIGKFDQNRSGLQGFGIQQDNPGGLRFYYYDAGTGQILWSYSGAVGDVGRGDAGDIDPRYPGFEVWAFDGIWNGTAGLQIAPTAPYPCLRLWWDGDDLSESFNDGKIEEWNYSFSSVARLVTTWNCEGATRSDRGAPMFYGDIWGDWREETVQTNGSFTKLVIFTTDIPTSRRLYTLPHNPEYRNSMTVKGYMQSHHVDYYLGDGMTNPPAPNIQLVRVKFNPADIVENGRIDLCDFAVLAWQWNKSPAMPSADIVPAGGDGIVDQLDLQALCSNWLAAEEQ